MKKQNKKQKNLGFKPMSVNPEEMLAMVRGSGKKVVICQSEDGATADAIAEGTGIPVSDVINLLDQAKVNRVERNGVTLYDQWGAYEALQEKAGAVTFMGFF